ncbi:hypothetical protein CEXT_701691 [Caerostris extrusa]|uniref:Uncharacterized protein n=1 Tax=Caerostris extrusa TaxID=172846 RepID=A0AAV4X191_CAEEX|nr:hypothetical protein CEXT_701691 [Caerostris extrusa]
MSPLPKQPFGQRKVSPFGEKNPLNNKRVGERNGDDGTLEDGGRATPRILVSGTEKVEKHTLAADRGKITFFSFFRLKYCRPVEDVLGRFAGNSTPAKKTYDGWNLNSGIYLLCF